MAAIARDATTLPEIELRRLLFPPGKPPLLLLKPLGFSLN